MLRLRSLKLENFLSHSQTEIEFDDEAYVILGKNASGKTSILRGIFFALFGKDFSSDKLERIVNKEHNKLSVSLSFIHRGHPYTINRKFSAVRKKSEAELWKSGKIHAVGVKNVNEFVETELNLNPNIFRNTVYIPQGEILTLFEIARREKRQVLNKLLGLEEIGEKHEKVKLFLGKLKAVRDNLLDRQRDFQEIESEVGKIKEEMDKTETKLKSLETEYRQENNLLESQKELYSGYTKKREQFKLLTESVVRLEEQLKSYSMDVERLRQKIEEIEGEKVLIPQLEEEVKPLEHLKRMSSILGRLKEKRIEKQEIEVKLREVERQEKEIEERRERLPELQKTLSNLQLFLKEKKNEFRKAEKQLKETQATERVYNKLQVQLSEKESSLKVLENEIEKLTSSTGFDSIEERREKILKEVQSAESEIALLTSKVSEAEERSRILRVCENPNCPVCGAPMNEMEKEKLLLQSEREISTGRTKLKALESKKRKLKGLLKSVEEELQKSLQIKERQEQLNRERERLLSEIEKLRNSLNALQFNPATVEKIEEAFISLRDEIVTTEEKRKELLKEIKRVETELKDLSTNFNGKEKENFQKRLMEVKSQIEELLNEVKRIKSENRLTVSSANEVEEEIAKLENVKERLNKIQGEVENLNFYYKERKKKGTTIKKLRDEIISLKGKLKQLDYSEDEFTTVEKTFQKQKEKVEFLQNEISKESGRLEILKKQYSTDIRKLKRKENNLHLLAKVEDSIRMVSTIAQSIHPEKGFLQKVRKSLLPRITIYCREFFDDFNFEFGDIDISEDLTVTFGIPGKGTMQVGEFSGGQQIAFALSLRFAMARYFAQNFELLILDEPTIHLDQQRRQNLTELLLKLKTKIPQMIIVTHDPELEVVGDSVIKVENVTGTSEVTVE